MKHSSETYDEATQFAHDVDQLLTSNALQESTDAAYQADLGLASLLSRAHFPVDPHFEVRLRNHLHQISSSKEAPIMTKLQLFFRTATAKAVLVVAAVSLLLAVSLAVSSEARAAARSLMAHFVAVGSPMELLPVANQPRATAEDNQSGAQPDPRAGAAQPMALPSGQLKQPGLGVPQNVPGPNIQPTRDLISLEKAQAGVSFTIKLPTSLPKGTRLLGAVPMPKLPTDGPKAPADAPKVDLPGSVMLIFGNDNGGLWTFSQLRLPNAAAHDIQLPVQGNVQSVTVNGQVGQYVEIENQGTTKGRSSTLRQLHWQSDDGFMYDLMSTVLSREQLESIAGSIK